MKKTRRRVSVLARSLVVGMVAGSATVGLQGSLDHRASSPSGPQRGLLDFDLGRGLSPSARPQATQTGGVDEAEPADRVEGSFIVDLAPGLDPKAIAKEVARDYGGRVNFVYDAVIGGFEFRGPDEAGARMANDPRVEAVDANYEVHTADTLTHIEQVNAPPAWTAPGSTGTDIRIAILDTGVRSTHPAFAGRIVEPYAGCVGESSAEDRNGHGTATASQAGGTHGVAPGASIVPIKVFPGSGSSTDWGKVICGINRVKTKGYEVANMSLSGSGTSALQTAVQQAAETAVLVAAAGNSGGGVGYPARYGEVLAVSGFAGDSRLASFSSRGSAVDIAAPGVNICSADINQGSSDCSNDMDPNRLRSGTSRAAPQVAGAAAVLRAAGVPLSEVEGLLKHGGDCPGGTANTGPGNCPTGSWSGDSDGIAEPFLDVARSIGLANTDPLPTGSFVNPTQNEEVSGDYTIRVAAADDDTAECALDVDIKIGSVDYSQATCDPATKLHALSWDTPDWPDGSITLTARITEPGNGAKTITRTAIVDNIDDPPTASWVAPTEGATVSPTFTATVSASDDKGVTSLELFVDGTSQGQMSLSSGQYTKIVGPLGDGAHLLRADVSDGVNDTVQKSISVTVTDELYSQRFDTPGSTGWSVSGRYQLWHISSSCGAARSSPNGVYYGRDSTCDYSNGQANYGILYTPWIDELPSSYSMTVSSKREVESCSSCSRDRTYIQVNYGDGRGWQRMYYKDARNSSDEAWETLNFSLGSSTGKVRARFVFYTGSSHANGSFGWAIDDFVLGAG